MDDTKVITAETFLSELLTFHTITSNHDLSKLISPGLIRHFGLDPADCHSFFRLVEAGYHSANPYHTAMHAADVTQVPQNHTMQYRTTVKMQHSIFVSIPTNVTQYQISIIHDDYSDFTIADYRTMSFIFVK